MLIIGNFAFAQRSSSTTTTTVVELTATEARSKDAAANVHVHPIICDVELKKYQAGADWCIETEFNKIDKKTSRFTDYWFLTFSDLAAMVGNGENKFTWGQRQRDEIKNYGMFRSQQYHHCDIIVAPIFNFRTASQDERQSRGADYVIIISGYAGDFVNFKNVTDADLNLLEHDRKLNTYSNGLQPITKDLNITNDSK